MTITAQEIFDKAVGGVIRQGDLSVALSGRCYYRHPNNKLACGVGHLLNDETAKRLDEIQQEGGSSEIHKVPINLIPAELHPYMELLKEIQKMHDDAGNDHDDPAPRLIAFVSRMKFVAERFGLGMKFTIMDVEEALT